MPTMLRPIWSKTGALTTTPSVVYLPNGWNQLELAVDARCLARVGSAYTAPGVASVNGVTTISSGGGATGGGFYVEVFPQPATLTDGGLGYAATTALVPYNESAANIKTALVATGYFASGDITAAGGVLPTDVTLTWTGVYAGQVPRLNIRNALTGDATARIYARTTTNPAGNGGYGYLEIGPTYWTADQSGEGGRFLYIAAVTGTANYFVTALR